MSPCALIGGCLNKEGVHFHAPLLPLKTGNTKCGNNTTDYELHIYNGFRDSWGDSIKAMWAATHSLWLH